MSRMFGSTGCIVAALLLTASNASAGSGYEYYAPYPRTYQYAPYPRTYQYAPYPGGYQFSPYARAYNYAPYPRGYDYARYPRAYYYAPPTYYAPGNYGYLAPPAAYYAPPAPVPLRPSNCGQYRFWNGQYCADARYQLPYLGPRW